LESGVRPQRLFIRILQALLLVLAVVWFCVLSGRDLREAQIPAFLMALSISWWLTPEIRARAMRLKLVDMPNEERRIHKVPVPRLGGVAIFISLLTTLALMCAIAGRFPKPGGLAGIAVGGTLIFVLGLIDDLESIPAKVKLLVQILAGCAAYSLGVRIKMIPINMDIGAIHLHYALSLGPWSLPLTVFWLVGVANAVNLIDGMDGLAAGTAAISALTIWAVALAPNINQPNAALIAAALAGALLGFLRWNFNPARIFLGDSGAYLTGFILGAVSITGVLKSTTAVTLIVPTFILVLLILFFPLLDTTWAIVRRVSKGRSIFAPDAEHIHHRLLQTGLSQKKVAYLIYGASALLGLLAAHFVGQESYFLTLGVSVLAMALFFAEVLNRHRQRPRKNAADGTVMDEPEPAFDEPIDQTAEKEKI
jgi:UDP-GlcNAc:undecaprenyl-phosphate/decaprenyl-phosphate GlcNAc-1-phosphate transferase